jgi:hypothetical protein
MWQCPRLTIFASHDPMTAYLANNAKPTHRLPAASSRGPGVRSSDLEAERAKQHRASECDGRNRCWLGVLVAAFNPSV